MKVIGLTGGIGSGKSTVGQFFAELGVPVYVADQQAKEIMDQPETIREVQALFDENVRQENGKLNRKKIAQIVFNNKKKLRQLNDIVHTKVLKNFKSWLKNHQNHSYVIKEVAVLFETQSENQFDQIILITAPEKLRIERVMKRNNSSYQEVMERIKNQLPDSEKSKKSNFIIENINLNDTKNKIKKLHYVLNNW